MNSLPQYMHVRLFYNCRSARRLAVRACLVTFLLCISAPADTPTVGIEGATNIVLAGPLLYPKPVNEKALVVLRIVDTYPHGTATRYDLRYIGLLPGSFDLREYLVYADGSPATNLPEITVDIAPLLPEDHSGRLVEEALQTVPLFSRFRELVVAVWIVWALLLIPLVFMKRKRKAGDEPVQLPHQPTLAERLQPLVEKAAEGTLTPEEQSHLEMLLIAYWRQELSLESLSMNDSLVRLKQHPVAGELLRTMEQWLYKPPGLESIDVTAILEPYRAIAAAPSVATESMP